MSHMPGVRADALCIERQWDTALGRHRRNQNITTLERQMPAAAQQPAGRTTAEPSGGALRIVPALSAPCSASGGMTLTQKFVDGVDAYAERWPGSGPVQVYLKQETHRARHLDEVDVEQGRDEDRFQWIQPNDDASLQAIVDGAAVLLITLVDTNLEIINRAIQSNVPFVLITELSERTREQIIDAETGNPVLRWRRKLWSRRIEREYLNAVKHAAGVQCNGTPTFEAYSSICDNALLYLDSRVTQSMLVTVDELAERANQLLSGAPLRLAFSGRLTAIKGADDLPAVARKLRELNIPFTFDTIGGGEAGFETRMRKDIETFGLSDCVQMKGVMDFEHELMPYMRRNVDVFVCCHRQGDPSCTYLETLSCGVPIAGYNNEAWQGLVDHGAPEWLAPMNDPAALAKRIAELHGNRQAVVQAGAEARRFAAQHTFERTMDQRMAHLVQCAGARLVERR